MINWGDLLADIRNDLEDTSSSPRWTDAYLYSLLKDALRDYSTWFPKRVDRYELTLSGSAYPLPVDFVADITCECPQDTFLTRRHESPGKAYVSDTLSNYYISGGSLYLNASPEEGDEVLLTYFALHPVPISSTDVTFVLTVPDVDIELIRIYVRASAHTRMRAKQARLDRFDIGSGRRDDNPLLPETINEMEDYYRKIAQRLGGGAITLYYTGRTQ
jgi:hypothetical protein